MSTWPPDGRLEGPVHTWFGLSYSNYQVMAEIDALAVYIRDGSRP